MTALDVCNICGRPAEDAHHCLIGRSKRHPELDNPFNLEPLCRECHTNRANSYEHRREFFRQQKERYGDEFLEWWDNLHLKVKPKYE
ncbi:MAG: hypothetical protein ABFD82_13465 [Syntrophaceae bacterium]